MKAVLTYLKRLPLFLITIPAFLLIHIEREYHRLLNYAYLYEEILQLLLAPVIIFLVSFVLFKDWRKSSLYTGILLICYYFFCDIKDWLHQKAPNFFFSGYIFLIPVLIVVVVASFIAIRKRTHFNNAYLFLNSLFILFIIADGVALIAKRNTGRLRSNSLAASYTTCQGCDRPDIYYIVSDAYTSSKVLKEEFNYENPIDSFLIQRKFFIPQSAKSNYNLTPFSIASTLNLDYLHNLDARKDFYLKEYLPGIMDVYNSELVPILKKEGYEVYNHSIFDFESAPSNVTAFDLWEMNLLYVRHNFFKKVDMDIGWRFRALFGLPVENYANRNYAKERDEHVFNTLQQLGSTIAHEAKAPRFVYAHILIPHSPYTFDSTGNKHPTQISRSDDQDMPKYKSQLVYTNKVLMPLIERILANKRTSIIVLQGDHGYKFKSAEKRLLEFSVLNAVYYPDSDYSTLNDSISNVNTFRFVLNKFFRKNYPILNDTTYFLQYK